MCLLETGLDLSHVSGRDAGAASGQFWFLVDLEMVV